MNDNIIAKDEADSAANQIAEGVAERDVEIEEPCTEANCPHAAEWFYGGFEDWRYCDLHVPRGKCSCTIDEDGNQERGEDGRLLTCADWMYHPVAA